MAKTPRITAANLGGWVFRCNPDVYDLPQVVQDGEDKVWDWLVAKSYQTDVMAPGQRVVLWVGGPPTATRTPGLWGIGYVTGLAYLRVDAHAPSDSWLDDERAADHGTETPRRGRYMRTKTSPAAAVPDRQGQPRCWPVGRGLSVDTPSQQRPSRQADQHGRQGIRRPPKPCASTYLTSTADINGVKRERIRPAPSEATSATWDR